MKNILSMEVYFMNSPDYTFKCTWHVRNSILYLYELILTCEKDPSIQNLNNNGVPPHKELKSEK